VAFDDDVAGDGGRPPVHAEFVVVTHRDDDTATTQQKHQQQHAIAIPCSAKSGRAGN
jgi:hypothetical protein